jgi:hypothetical protein
MAMAKLRRSKDKDGTIKNEKLATMMSNTTDSTSGFHVGGFALGFLIGLIGVLIAYLINDDKKSNRVKWSWIGCAIGLVLGLLLIL